MKDTNTSTNVSRSENRVLGVFTDEETGEEAVITEGLFKKIMGEMGESVLDEALSKSWSVTKTYAPGIIEIDLHPQKTALSRDGLTLLLTAASDSFLAPGSYFVLYLPVTGIEFSDEELANIKEGAPDGLLLATDSGQLIGEGISPVPITITPINEKGDTPEGEEDIYELALWLIKSEETGAYVTLWNLLESAMAQVVTNATLERLQKQGDISITKGKNGKAPNISIRSKAISRVDFATDKLNRKAWKQWENLPPDQLALGFAEDGNGQLSFDFANGIDKKAGIQRLVSYAINFDELEEEGIAPKLEPYDKRVYEALSSLWEHVTKETGQETFTITDVYNAMGYTKKPSAHDKERINDSITKMNKAHIWVDSLHEASAYRYPRFKYDGSALPMERVAGYVDGQLSEGLIHLFREPPLFSFARERKQISSFSVKLLQSPLSKTSKNLLIEDYLREEIAWMRNEKGNRSHRILLETIFKEVGIKSRDSRLRKRKDILALLDHYVSIGFITSYKERDGGFDITI